MHYRKIIGDAWAFTQSSKRLVMWFAFLPAIVTTIYEAVVFTYYYIIMTNEEGTLGFYKSVFKGIKTITDGDKTLLVWMIVAFVIFFLFKQLYPTFANGAIIQYAAHRRESKDITIGKSFSYGMRSFLPLFEYHLLIHTFSLNMYATFIFFLYRHLPTNAMVVLVPIFALSGILFLIIGLVVTYSEMYIVLKKEGVVQSIKNSAWLVIDNWQYTFLVLMLLLMISLRMIFNLIVIIVLPVLIIAGAGFFASLQFHVLGYILAGIVSLIGLYLAGILGGNLHVFTNAVWTFTFLELTAEAEE